MELAPKPFLGRTDEAFQGVGLLRKFLRTALRELIKVRELPAKSGKLLQVGDIQQRASPQQVIEYTQAIGRQPP